jgi:hypothetical protein
MKRQCLWLMLKTSLLPYHIEVIKASKSKKKKKTRRRRRSDGSSISKYQFD